MVDRPATTSTLLTVASGQDFGTSLVPTAVGNVTKVFDVDSSNTDTSISGAYIDEIFLTYGKRTTQFIDAKAATTGTYVKWTLNRRPTRSSALRCTTVVRRTTVSTSTTMILSTIT